MTEPGWVTDGQLGGLSREQRLQLLVRLRKKLQALSSSLNTAARDCGIQVAVFCHKCTQPHPVVMGLLFRYSWLKSPEHIPELSCQLLAAAKKQLSSGSVII